MELAEKRSIKKAAAPKTTSSEGARSTNKEKQLELKKGPWTAEEDELLVNYITSKQAGEAGGWRTLPKKAGLLRCGKSCRLRWMNYLRPNVKRGHISPAEEDLILRLHRLLGNRWSLIAGRIPGRTDNEIKNYWNTHLSKKLIRQGIDPRTHKPFSDPLNIPSIKHKASNTKNIQYLAPNAKNPNSRASTTQSQTSTSGTGEGQQYQYQYHLPLISQQSRHVSSPTEEKNDINDEDSFRHDDNKVAQDQQEYQHEHDHNSKATNSNFVENTTTTTITTFHHPCDVDDDGDIITQDSGGGGDNAYDDNEISSFLNSLINDDMIDEAIIPRE